MARAPARGRVQEPIWSPIHVLASGLCARGRPRTTVTLVTPALLNRLTKPASVPVWPIVAARNFTQFLPHAPMVTVSLEEPALASARTLVRVLYLGHLLALVQTWLRTSCRASFAPAAAASAISVGCCLPLR